MRFLCSLWILLWTAQIAVANDIDRLKTQQDVEKFLLEKVSPQWKDKDIFSNKIEGDTSAYRKGSFFKIDLDNDSRTDLIINGKPFFVVIDKGNGKYESKLLNRWFSLKDIVYKGSIALLIVENGGVVFLGEKKVSIDILVLKSGKFFNYNPNPDNLKIETISFSTSYCYGTCPVFKLDIQADRTAKYNAIEYNPYIRN